jgi:hypothetical protein
MTAREQAAIDKLKALHPDARDIKVTAVTRKAVFLRFDCKKLGKYGLFVDSSGIMGH